MTLKKTSILDGDEIKAITAELRVLMPGLAEVADRMGHDLEAGARLMSLKAKCTEVREKKGLSIKDVAKQLGVPQYRIKAIEAGTLSEIDAVVLRRYFELLGLGRWVTINAEWHRQHPMPKNPTVEQRITWHLAHQEHCACRPIPDKLKAVIAGRQRKSGTPS